MDEGADAAAAAGDAVWDHMAADHLAKQAEAQRLKQQAAELAAAAAKAEGEAALAHEAQRVALAERQTKQAQDEAFALRAQKIQADATDASVVEARGLGREVGLVVADVRQYDSVSISAALVDRVVELLSAGHSPWAIGYAAQLRARFPAAAEEELRQHFDQNVAAAAQIQEGANAAAVPTLVYVPVVPPAPASPAPGTPSPELPPFG